MELIVSLFADRNRLDPANERWASQTDKSFNPWRPTMMTAEQAAEYGWGTSGDDAIESPAAGPDTNWATESRGNDRVYYPSELEDTIWEVESRGDDYVVEPETAEFDGIWPMPDGFPEYGEEYQFYL